jgi:hypothetical protein
MKKKENYEQPLMEEIAIEQSSSLLAGSPLGATIRNKYEDETVNTDANSTTDEQHGSDGSGNSFFGF